MIKSCQPEWQYFYDRYIQDELYGEDFEKFTEHLSTCVVCSSSLKVKKELIRLLGHKPTVELPSDFESKLHKKIDDLETRRNGFFFKHLEWITFFLVLIIGLTSILCFYAFDHFEKQANVQEQHLIEKN